MKKHPTQKPKSKKDNVLRIDKSLKVPMPFKEFVQRIVRVKPEEIKTK